VHSLGRAVTDEELANHLGVRKNNLKKRNIRLLLKLELLEPKEGGYVTPSDIEDRLERELEELGCNKAERLQREKYERERRAWRERGKATNPTVLIEVDEQRLEMVNPREETIQRTCHLDADGIVRHDPLCDDDCTFYLGYSQTQEQEFVA